MSKKESVPATYRIGIKTKASLDEINKKHPEYTRLRSLCVDLGIQAMVGLVHKKGPEWFFKNNESIVSVILDNM